LEIVVGKLGIGGPKKGQRYGDDQKETMEQEFDH